MAIRRFRDMYNDYIEVGDFEKTIEVTSPTYGNYKMTKVATIDLIKACENMKLGPVHDFYSKLRTEFPTSRSLGLEIKRFGGEGRGGQNLSKFEFYVPISEDNLDWEVPEGAHPSFKPGRLPVAIRKENIQEIINKIKP
jgi:hypothetical protein